VFPKVWLNLAAALLLAGALGFGAALWEEERDERIYSTATIGDVSGLTTVAILREQA
jgi:capsular polysaccharide biosynthesis protein